MAKSANRMNVQLICACQQKDRQMQQLMVRQLSLPGVPSNTPEFHVQGQPECVYKYLLYWRALAGIPKAHLCRTARLRGERERSPLRGNFAEPRLHVESDNERLKTPMHLTTIRTLDSTVPHRLTTHLGEADASSLHVYSCLKSVQGADAFRSLSVVLVCGLSSSCLFQTSADSGKQGARRSCDIGDAQLSVAGCKLTVEEQ